MSLEYTNAAAKRDLKLGLVLTLCAKVNLHALLVFPKLISCMHLIFLDIDECVTESHNCSSDNWQICNNTEGSFECVCESGYNLSAVGNCEGINRSTPPSPH